MVIHCNDSRYDAVVETVEKMLTLPTDAKHRITPENWCRMRKKGSLGASWGRKKTVKERRATEKSARKYLRYILTLRCSSSSIYENNVEDSWDDGESDWRGR